MWRCRSLRRLLATGMFVSLYRGRCDEVSEFAAGCASAGLGAKFVVVVTYVVWRSLCVGLSGGPVGSEGTLLVAVGVALVESVDLQVWLGMLGVDLDAAC